MFSFSTDPFAVLLAAYISAGIGYCLTLPVHGVLLRKAKKRCMEKGMRLVYVTTHALLPHRTYELHDLNGRALQRGLSWKAAMNAHKIERLV